jgi:hypothetical protein
MQKLSFYAGVGASGFIWGTIAYMLNSFVRAPAPYSMDAFQELAIWSTAGAVASCIIAFVWERFTQRARQREEQRRKIRIAE